MATKIKIPTKINLSINGKDISAPKGTTILDAAEAAGFKIPTLCHDARLSPYGSCRVCLVEVEGAKGPITACSAEVTEGMKVTTENPDIKELRKLSIELLLSNHWADCVAPCVLACPANTDAQGYIGLIKQKRYREAVKLIKETNPFPSIIGRVCTRPCEDACRRNLVEGNLAICHLKRFAGDWDLTHGKRYVPDVKKSTGKKAAVVGAGPAGLSAAYYLASLGHKVTVFEAMPEAGGMLRYGMPAYRLPKDLLDKEISMLKTLGAEIRTGISIGKDITLKQLTGDFDAVFTGIGAQNGSNMGIAGENLKGVLSGIDFLRQNGLGKEISLKGKVIVVGGGNTAIDAARTARRLGAEVTLVYRRSRQEMPAHPAEVTEAEKEGITLKLLVNPVSINGNGKVEQVRCIRMELGEPDESGRRRPVEVKGSEFLIEADYVIAAIGQQTDLEGFQSLQASKRGTFEVDSDTLQTSGEKIFAGGDAVTGPNTAIGAIAAGRRAAFAMDAFMKGKKAELWPDTSFSTQKIGATEEDYKDEPVIEKQEMPELELDKRTDFEEVELGFDEKKALAEAERCLQCGCVKQEDCDLRQAAIEHDAKQETFEGEMQHYDCDTRHPMLEQNMNKCILCARCVRICDEVTGAEALTLVDRGYSAKVGTAFDKPLHETSCVSCGQCVSTCPTASLTEKKDRFDREYSPMKKVTTVCPYCGVGCKITYRVDGAGKIHDTYFKSREGLSEGNLCVKGRFAYKFIQHPDRLTTPLIKENGKFRKASWEEALDLVAAKIAEAKQMNGPDSVAVLASAKCTNEENYLIQKYARAAIGTNNVDHCARLCHASTVTGLAKVFGSGAMTNSISDLDKAEVIIIIGSNTTETHPIIGYKIRKAAKEGRTKLIVIDPRKIELAGFARHYLAQSPGSDIAVINAIAKVILDAGLIDEKFIASRTEGFDGYKKSLDEYTPEKTAEITGIGPGDLKKAALLFGKAKNGAIVYSMGITQHACGTDNVSAIANLAMMTGNIGREGTGVNPLRGQNNVQGACDMGALPNVYSGYQSVTDELVRKKMEEAWGKPLSDKAGLTVTEIIEKAGKGEVKVLHIVGENPALSDPDLKHIREDLEKTEFLVVQDIFLSETAIKADVVLPAASFAEKDGAFTNTERRIQLLNKVIEPVGESRPDWQIIADISNRIGYKMNYSGTAEIMDEISTVTPIYGGAIHSRLKGEGLQWPCPDKNHPGTPVLHSKEFTRGKGLFQATGHKPPAEQTDSQYPITLTTGRILEQYHTGTMTRKNENIEELAGESYVEVSAKDAAALGLKEGSPVWVSSRRGKIKVKARIIDIKEGVAFIPFHYAEAAANELTNKALDPFAKIPELKVCAVKIEKA